MTNTTTTFDRMTNDDRWLGFGYLGARQNALTSTDPEAPAQPERVAQADQYALEVANQQDMTYDELFEWANSKLGRWFGDVVFGQAGPIEAALAEADRFGYAPAPVEESDR